MIENRIIAVATSKKTSSTPISTIPPAMPNTPDRNELTMMVKPIRAQERRDIAPYAVADRNSDGSHRGGRAPQVHP